MPPKNEPRLHVYLARAGIGSRRRCEEYMAAGRVRVDGRLVREPGSRVPEGARVEVDGRLVRPETHVYLAVHKPAGYVCSSRKADQRPIVAELFREAVPGRLFTVGRLDMLSSGLILATNDGEFANAVAHPSGQVEKEYLVDTVDAVPERTTAGWRRGVTVEGVRYTVRSVLHLSPTRLSLTLVEGRNREIRRILEAFGLRIRRVHRVRIGKVSLRGLRPGAFRHLSADEIRGFRASGGEKPPVKARKVSRRGLVHKNAQRRPAGPLT